METPELVEYFNKQLRLDLKGESKSKATAMDA